MPDELNGMRNCAVLPLREKAGFFSPHHRGGNGCGSDKRNGGVVKKDRGLGAFSVGGKMVAPFYKRRER